MHDGQLSPGIKALQSRKPRVEGEEAIQIDRRLVAGPWSRNCNRRTGRIVLALAERYDHVQPIDRPAQEDRYQDLSTRSHSAAATVRVRNDGAKPRLTSARPPFRRKMRLEIMANPQSLEPIHNRAVVAQDFSPVRQGTPTRLPRWGPRQPRDDRAKALCHQSGWRSRRL